MIERIFDIPFVSTIAIREKQIQQNYRPIIAVHKWFARRPGSLFRSLMLSEFQDKQLREAYYQSHQMSDIHIVDPFMGGGTTLIEGNRLGASVTGFDINPMSFMVVNQEIKTLDLAQYKSNVDDLIIRLTALLGDRYKTNCLSCGSSASVKYFLWVKSTNCSKCSNEILLLPGTLLVENVRHPHFIHFCPSCHNLMETDSKCSPKSCPNCCHEIKEQHFVKRGKCTCEKCGTEHRVPNNSQVPYEHKLLAIEYYCDECKSSHSGRFFKSPDDMDLQKTKATYSPMKSDIEEMLPDDMIPAGDESSRLHKWGYHYYKELFNERQKSSLGILLSEILRVKDQVIQDAFITNFSDLLRYQNMLCRYDTMALKSLDIFSIHGFPVGLIQCESNVIGIRSKNGTLVGSGGLQNITEKYHKAKQYCEQPFEIRHEGDRKQIVPILGEWIGTQRSVDGKTEKKKLASTVGIRLTFHLLKI